MLTKILMAPLAAVVSTAAVAAGAQPVSVTWAEVAGNPEAYLGKRVLVADCMVMGYSDIVGAQCSPAPLDSKLLGYVDVGTMSADARKLGASCADAPIDMKCLVRVTGDVARDSRGQALIKNATMELVRRVPAVQL
jgi:hypothetical protein